MIMPRGQQLLQPVNPRFMIASIIVASILSMLPLEMWAWAPDVLMLVLVFWGIHQPRLVGMGVAFLMGLCMDVEQRALLGQHSLAYVLSMFLAHSVSRRVRGFPLWVQSFQLLPLFMMAHAVQMVSRMVTGGMFPGLLVILPPVLDALLWPLITLILLAPQRRAPDRDSTRPL